MSRNVYRLCNTSHIQSKPTNSKIIPTIAYWLSQLFAKPRLTMVCVTPSPSKLQQTFTDNKAAAFNLSTPATQKTIATNPVNTLEQAQEATHNLLNSKHIQTSITSAGSSIAKAGKKANMLFLKVYNGPIFEDKKVDSTSKAQTQTSSSTSQTSQLIKDPFCLPNQGQYATRLQRLNTPSTGKKPVIISGKMSDIFAQLDQLAA